MDKRDGTHCEICGCEPTQDNPLLDWNRYNSQDKIVCLRCTDDEMDRVYKLIGFTDKEIIALRKSRHEKA